MQKRSNEQKNEAMLEQTKHYVNTPIYSNYTSNQSTEKGEKFCSSFERIKVSFVEKK